MRPLALTMQAFGPFAGRQVVDFAALGDRPLFLIHGPTGAGKTTLLDAICFALYGDTSGGERDARAMRSDHAEPALPTEVEFTFALGDEQYCVTRRPAQRRPKQRGEGYTEAPATAQLDRLDGGGRKSVASQPGKVTAAIADRLGFDSTQFRQVIVLPQGRFRELLNARSDEREAILQTLFGTECYRVLADALKQEARALADGARTIEAKRQAVLQQADAETAEALVERRGQFDADRAALRAQEPEARTRAHQAREQLEAGRRAQAVLREAADAAAAWERIERSHEEFDLRRTQIAAARRAERVRPLDLALIDARRVCRAADERRQAAQAALETSAVAREAAAAALQAEVRRESEREAAVRRVAELESLADQVAKLDAATRRRQLAERDAARLAGEVERRRNELALQRDLCAERGKALDALRQTAGRAESLALQVQIAQRRREQTDLRDRTRGEVERAQRAFSAAEAKAADTERALALARVAQDALEGEWGAGQAALLAAGLRDGEPCPVCGSREHPGRADGGEANGVGEDVLRGAREATRKAERALDAARRRRHEEEAPLSAAAARLRDLEQALAGVPDNATLDGQLDALRADLAAAETAAKEIEPLAAQIDALAAANARSESEVATIEKARVDATVVAAAAQSEVVLLRERLPEDLRGAGALEAALAEAKAQRSALEAALQQAREHDRHAASALAAASAAHRAAEAEWTRADEAARVAGGQFAAALADGLFAAEARYRECLRAPAAIDALERELAEYDNARAVAADRQARARQAAEGLIAPDLAALEAESAAAGNTLEALLARLQDVSVRIATTDRALAALVELATEARDVESRYAIIGRLAEVANGSNPRRMTFQRFVLATLLDEVLEAASQRLTRMSRGRFELRRVVGVLDQRSAGGLELEIFDHYTGTARPANTLSGGEGFLASLALALGLADVVQSRAGGIRMETLFIDEGFGTLDPESLDFALRTLIDLQQRGRLVGVISHVAELRERIDVRLEVRSGPRGSEVTLSR